MEHSPDPCTILLSEDFRMEPSLGSLHRYLYCETSARSLQHKIFAWGLHVGPLYGTFVGDLCMGPSSQDLLMGPLLHDLHARPYVGGPPRGTFTRGPSGTRPALRITEEGGRILRIPPDKRCAEYN
ncbi:hypothetical protein BDA96_05G151500 [Sorghum bicolor]|uniref:Uncharacterized protein n=1 Tax=Sorghum bicolor TaxID=4558 RepID=A0A921R0I6_SORBI|nr:hypothetical protein BDA96_05G151500 [Sorghum bicolor]